MATWFCTPGSLSGLVCCPRCHGHLQPGEGDCLGCGNPGRQEGPVVNFLGGQGFLLPDGSDVAKASWLMENNQRWEGLPAGSPPATYRHLASGPVTGDELEHTIAGSTFFQILNDIRRIRDGAEMPSPTVEFMLK